MNRKELAIKRAKRTTEHCKSDPFQAILDINFSSFTLYDANEDSFLVGVGVGQHRVYHQSVDEEQAVKILSEYWYTNSIPGIE